MTGRTTYSVGNNADDMSLYNIDFSNKFKEDKYLNLIQLYGSPHHNHTFFVVNLSIGELVITKSYDTSGGTIYFDSSAVLVKKPNIKTMGMLITSTASD